MAKLELSVLSTLRRRCWDRWRTGLGSQVEITYLYGLAILVAASERYGCKRDV